MGTFSSIVIFSTLRKLKNEKFGNDSLSREHKEKNTNFLAESHGPANKQHLNNNNNNNNDNDLKILTIMLAKIY